MFDCQDYVFYVVYVFIKNYVFNYLYVFNCLYALNQSVSRVLREFWPFRHRVYLPLRYRP